MHFINTYAIQTIKLSLALILCFSACIVYGEEEVNPYEGVLELKKTLDVPNAFYSIHFFNPATYLEMFEEEDLVALKDDTGKAKDPEKLRNLILEANKACYKKYHQTYLIDRNCSLFRMLEETFPELKKLEGEPLDGKPNQSVYLSHVANILTNHIGQRQIRNSPRNSLKEEIKNDDAVKGISTKIFKSACSQP